jgi:hypothetical protein
MKSLTFPAFFVDAVAYRALSVFHLEILNFARRCWPPGKSADARRDPANSCFREFLQPAALLRHADEGLPMASSEWMDLENLSREIADSNGRLEAAKAVGSLDLAKVLQREIEEMEERRSRILGHIASSVVGHQPEASNKDENDKPEDTAPENTPAEDTEAVEAVISPSAADPDPETAIGTKAGARNSSIQLSGDKAGMAWNQLTPADVERAREELDRRRTEMLARHADELKSLETDRAEIEGLEQAIGAFLRKFSAPRPGGEVVRLEDGKHLHPQAAD